MFCDIAFGIGFIFARYDIGFTLTLLANASARINFGAIGLAIPAMLRVIHKIPAPTLAFILRATLYRCATPAITILASFALRLAIPAMGAVGLKISAPIIAFILLAAVGFLA